MTGKPKQPPANETRSQTSPSVQQVAASSPATPLPKTKYPVEVHLATGRSIELILAFESDQEGVEWAQEVSTKGLAHYNVGLDATVYPPSAISFIRIDFLHPVKE